MAKKNIKKVKSNSGKSTGRADLIVGSKIRGLIKSNKCMTSSEFLPALAMFVKETVEAACQRAKSNKRSTVRAHDL